MCITVRNVSHLFPLLHVFAGSSSRSSVNKKIILRLYYNLFLYILYACTCKTKKKLKGYVDFIASFYSNTEDFPLLL